MKSMKSLVAQKYNPRPGACPGQDEGIRPFVNHMQDGLENVGAGL